MTLFRDAKRASAGKSQRKRHKLPVAHRRLQDGLSSLREKHMAKKHLWEDLQGFFAPNTAPIVQEAINYLDFCPRVLYIFDRRARMSLFLVDHKWRP
jgi:hypothetical protein